MSSPAKTPSPPQNIPAVTTNTPIAQPSTPGASTSPDTVPRKSNSRATTRPPQTPSTTVSPVTRTPGGTFVPCTADPAQMTIVSAHTAKCGICEGRTSNDEMRPVLQCPGCPSFRICKICRDKRAKIGQSLQHGSMSTPGGLSLGTGGPPKRHILPEFGSPSPAMRQDRSMSQETRMATPGLEPAGRGKGKGKEKAAPAPAPAGIAKIIGKKRAMKPKTYKSAIQEESSDDDFMPDPASPTSHKRRRTAPAITDEPTATASRPHRAAPASAKNSAYVALSSPDGSVTSAELNGADGIKPPDLTLMERHKQWNVDVASPSRIQELLEAAGVNTPDNRYDEHLMSTYAPNIFSPTIEIPGTVRRMANPTPRLTAEQKVDVRNKAAVVSHSAFEDDVVEDIDVDIADPNAQQEYARAEASSHMVRNFALREAAKYQSASLSADENEELTSEITKNARLWASKTHKRLPEVLQKTVDKGLDMRLDYVDVAFRADLAKSIEKCAARKVKEFEKEREGAEEDGAEE